MDIVMYRLAIQFTSQLRSIHDPMACSDFMSCIGVAVFCRNLLSIASHRSSKLIPIILIKGRPFSPGVEASNYIIYFIRKFQVHSIRYSPANSSPRAETFAHSVISITCFSSVHKITDLSPLRFIYRRTSSLSSP